MNIAVNIAILRISCMTAALVGGVWGVPAALSTQPEPLGEVTVVVGNLLGAGPVRLAIAFHPPANVSLASPCPLQRCLYVQLHSQLLCVHAAAACMQAYCAVWYTR